MPTFDEIVLDILTDRGIIKYDGDRIIVKDVDTAKLASEKLEKIIQDAYKMTEIIQDTKKKLEDYIVKYNELINKLPSYVENREHPHDLLENYYKLTKEIKELGIPEKIKRGQKLTLFEELKWRNWKNLHATVKFITEQTSVYDAIREMRRNYEELINICRNNLLQIEYIGQNFTEFIRLAEGVKDLLDTLSEMPREMIDMSALLANLNGMVIAFSKMFEFCTKDALSLEGTIDAKELFKDISTDYSGLVNNVRDGVNKAKEAGYDTSKVENKLEELAEFEEALRHASEMQIS